MLTVTALFAGDTLTPEQTIDAHEAATALGDLHRTGDINLHAHGWEAVARFVAELDGAIGDRP